MYWLLAVWQQGCFQQVLSFQEVPPESNVNVNLDPDLLYSLLSVDISMEMVRLHRSLTRTVVCVSSFSIGKSILA
ncbi:hypothetical protein C8J55DRAFT_518145 [Lentinula edodes]|uniref:Uncharacterized protein n=1 Tax=Lentinula lateritia TaxID=40482 RepID=A0A9W9DKX7_9AGAR|nr:hypothetical protein C8J55DRAFT_518145 [Lentinula edodes]